MNDKNDSSAEDGHYFDSGLSCWLVFIEESGATTEVGADKPALKRWVEQQRLDYLAFQSGRPSCLDEAKIARMNEKGFNWQIPSKEPKQAVAEDLEDEEDEGSKKPAARPLNNSVQDDHDNHQEDGPLPDMERMAASHEEGDPLMDTYDDSNFAPLEDPLAEQVTTNNTKTESDEEELTTKRRTRSATAAAKFPPAGATNSPEAADVDEEIKAEGSRYPRRTRRAVSESEAPASTKAGGPPAKRQKLEMAAAAAAAPKPYSKNDATTSPSRTNIHTYKIMKVSEKTGKKELRNYETRNMIRLIPEGEEAEAAAREQCREEFAELLKCEESLVTDKKRHVDHQTAKANVSWEEHFLDFLVFKKIYGHGIVPKVFPQNPSLGRWTVRNRRWWKNKDKRLSRSRQRRLVEAGFVWEAKKDPTFWSVQQNTTQEEDRWEAKFQMLLDYKNEKGDCLVPKEYKPNMVLARWVSEQRKQKKAKSEGKYNHLTDEREERLLEAGFVFNTRTKEMLRESVLKRFKDRWDESFQKLVQFKETYGHAAVPRRWKQDKDLASWAMRQRSHGKKYIRGEESYLTKERYELLKSVDFVFEMERAKYPMDRSYKPKPPPGESVAASATAAESTTNVDQMVEGVDAEAMEVAVEEAVAAAVAAGADDKMGLEPLAGVEITNTQGLMQSENNDLPPTAQAEAHTNLLPPVADVEKGEDSLKVSHSPETTPTRRSTRNKKLDPGETQNTRQNKRSKDDDESEEAPPAKRATRASTKASTHSTKSSTQEKETKAANVDSKRRTRQSKRGTPETPKDVAADEGKEIGDEEEKDMKIQNKEVEEPETQKEPDLEASVEEALLMKNKGRWTCEFCRKDEHLNYVKFIAHEASCAGLGDLAVPTNLPLE